MLIEAGCSMRKVKSRKYKKQKLILLLVAIVLGFGCVVRSFNTYMEPQLQAIAKQHTGFAINNIVKEVLADIEYDTDALFKINRTKNGDITSIESVSYTHLDVYKRQEYHGRCPGTSCGYRQCIYTAAKCRQYCAVNPQQWNSR